MKLTKCSIGMLTLFFLFFLQHIYAAHAQKRDFKISVTVSANEDLKNIVTQGISKELRSIADVSVVDSQPEWTLRIVAIGEKEIVIAYTISETLHNQRFGSAGFKMELAAREYLKINYPETIIKPPWEIKSDLADIFLVKNPSHSDIYVAQGVMICTRQQLQDICKKIAAMLDVEYLEDSRKLLQSLEKIFKK